VVFDNTGAAEIVQHKVTGYVATSFDPVDLTNGVGWLLADRQRHAETTQGGALVQSRLQGFSPVTAAREYLVLYREKLGVLPDRRTGRAERVARASRFNGLIICVVLQTDQS
jgi:hypothetical protein